MAPLRLLLLKLLVKINQLFVKKSSHIVSGHTGATCRLNVVTTISALLDVNAKLIVYFTLRSTAKDVTALPVPVTAVQTGVIVVLTNINILRKMHGMIIVIHW